MLSGGGKENVRQKEAMVCFLREKGEKGPGRVVGKEKKSSSGTETK